MSMEPVLALVPALALQQAIDAWNLSVSPKSKLHDEILADTRQGAEDQQSHSYSSNRKSDRQVQISNSISCRCVCEGAALNHACYDAAKHALIQLRDRRGPHGSGGLSGGSLALPCLEICPQTPNKPLGRFTDGRYGWLTWGVGTRLRALHEMPGHVFVSELLSVVRG